MQILVHIAVLECIMRRLLRTRNACVQVLQLASEAHAHLERVGHLGRLGLLSFARRGDAGGPLIVVEKQGGGQRW